MVSDALINRSADIAARFTERAAKLSLDIERQIANRDGPLCYILASAHQEAVAAFLELATIDPTNSEKIRDLQFRIERYSTMGEWLSHAVAQGFQAFKELENPEIVDEWVKEFSASSFEDAS